jgi:hypothetical protein
VAVASRRNENPGKCCPGPFELFSSSHPRRVLGRRPIFAGSRFQVRDWHCACALTPFGDYALLVPVADASLGGVGAPLGPRFSWLQSSFRSLCILRSDFHRITTRSWSPQRIRPSALTAMMLETNGFGRLNLRGEAPALCRSRAAR